jgi:hypothetical protein
MIAPAYEFYVDVLTQGGWRVWHSCMCWRDAEWHYKHLCKNRRAKAVRITDKHGKTVESYFESAQAGLFDNDVDRLRQ